MKRILIALATSLGIAAGSIGMGAAPAAAAMMAPTVKAETPVQFVKHGRHHHRHLVCRTVWVKKKVWRHHHRVWIKVPKRQCHYVWRHW